MHLQTGKGLALNSHVYHSNFLAPSRGVEFEMKAHLFSDICSKAFFFHGSTFGYVKVKQH